MAYFSNLWIFFSALVSSNALGRWSERCTDVSIDTSLKSQVFLPCHFNTSLNDTVTWRHLNNGDTLVKIIADGRIYFDNPREGRVSVLPNVFEEGNFSIFIHDLESSDVGVYFCEWNSECWRVRITESHHHPSQEADRNSWLFFFAGLQNRLLSCTSNACKYKSESEEHNQACKSPDPNDPTTSTVTYVIQA
ncbi:uncharacterized protein isoform X2 [Danio rerio]|uniref:Uncharacterized protein isoform X2 n=1 Tax=Danio rerio TaxID=7955 RepID=A0AC58HC94_DANRE